MKNAVSSILLLVMFLCGCSDISTPKSNNVKHFTSKKSTAEVGMQKLLLQKNLEMMEGFRVSMKALKRTRKLAKYIAYHLIRLILTNKNLLSF